MPEFCLFLFVYFVLWVNGLQSPEIWYWTVGFGGSFLALLKAPPIIFFPGLLALTGVIYWRISIYQIPV